MQKLPLLVLLTSFLSFPSCVSRPSIDDTPQCSPVFVYSPDENFIDRQESYCQCRTYRFSISYVGAVSGTITREPIEKCDRLVGWEPVTYARVARFWDAVRAVIEGKDKDVTK